MHMWKFLYFLNFVREIDFICFYIRKFSFYKNNFLVISLKTRFKMAEIVRV